MEPQRNLTLDELLEQIQALVPNATIDRSNFSINITLIEQNFTEEAHNSTTSFGIDLDDDEEEEHHEPEDSHKNDTKPSSKTGSDYYNGYMKVKSYVKTYYYYYSGYTTYAKSYFTPGSTYNYYSYSYKPYVYTYSYYRYKSPQSYTYYYDSYYYYEPKTKVYTYSYSYKYYGKKGKKKSRGNKWKDDVKDFIDDVKNFVGHN